jgi:hypothetical protein
MGFFGTLASVAMLPITATSKAIDDICDTPNHLASDFSTAGISALARAIVETAKEIDKDNED